MAPGSTFPICLVCGARMAVDDAACRRCGTASTLLLHRPERAEPSRLARLLRRLRRR